MAIKNVVIPVDLGPEFAQGTEVANKITLRASADAGNLVTNGSDSRPFTSNVGFVSSMALVGTDLVVNFKDSTTSTIDLSSFAVDISGSGATINPATMVLTIAQTNGGPSITVDLTELKNVNVANTATVNIAGDGNGTPLAATVNVSATAGNQLTAVGDGLFVAAAAAETTFAATAGAGVTITAGGTAGHAPTIAADKANLFDTELQNAFGTVTLGYISSTNV